MIDLDALRSKEDSTDLTDDEIAGAIPVGTEKDLARKIGDAVCTTCGQRAVRYRYAIRRRTPHIYWRIICECEGHESTIVFRADWDGGKS